MSVYRLLEQVAQVLRPSEDVYAVLDHVLAEINKQLSLREINAQASAGGSVAKGTFLRTSHDVDVFVRFEREYVDDSLADVLASCVKGFSARRVHGSRDYFLFDFRGFSFEVVPVLRISKASEARNVTDASPLHVEYFRRRGEGLEDEVRLAKQFAKAAGVYGAESFIRGFSGHVIDLLVIRYGSFLELVRAACRWEAPVVIDIESHHKNPLLAIDQAKHAPLLLVDPIQPSRNAAAALSKEQFLAFVEAAQRFVEAPSAQFFRVEQFSMRSLIEELADVDGYPLLLELDYDVDEKQDVAGARVRKFFERLRDELVRAGFEIVRSDWRFVSPPPAVAYFVLQQRKLSEFVERAGPPVSESVHANRFREEHGDAVEQRGEWLFARVKRDVRTPEELLEIVGSTLSAQTQVDFSRVDIPGT